MKKTVTYITVPNFRSSILSHSHLSHYQEPIQDNIFLLLLIAFSHPSSYIFAPRGHQYSIT